MAVMAGIFFNSTLESYDPRKAFSVAQKFSLFDFAISNFSPFTALNQKSFSCEASFLYRYMPHTMSSSPLLWLPDELLIQISSHLDILSIFALADSCSLGRHRLLSIRSIWQHITFDSDRKNLHSIYATLRRFRDDDALNHLKPIVESVSMDSFDDPMISPIVMLVKFPNLRHIRARNRRYTTSIESDAKVLQEFLNQGKITEHSLKLETYELYHPYMNEERMLRRFQTTLNALARSGSVELDIRQCSHTADPVPVLEDATNDTPPEDIRPANLSLQCRRIICKSAKCWACGEPEVFCYQCVDKCAKCGLRRLPPFVNDIHVLEAAGRPTDASNQTEDDMFSLFE
jgi:hypothetical protein